MTDITANQSSTHENADRTMAPEAPRKRERYPNALTGAERTNAFRERLKKRMRCFTVELQETECDRLAWLFGKNRETIRAAYDSAQRQGRREIVRNATGEVRAALYAFLDLIQVADWATTLGNREAVKQAIEAYFEQLFVPPETSQRAE